MDELVKLDATAQAELVRSSAVTPAELVDAAIARIERINPQLNAVIIPLFEKARAEVRSAALPEGPFRGVPLVIKDLICTTAGDPYHAGMRLLRERRWTASADTYLAAKFRAAGFVIVGRANAPELGPIATTEPVAYGATRNPWDLTRSPGGSSGGSAAAVASGMVPVAHGGDGGGSIRIPSGACGLFGLKPSRGRTSMGPEFGEAWGGAVVEHVLTRSVRDSAAILDAVHGPMPGDPYVAPAPGRPFRAEVGAPTGRLRIGMLRHAPGGFYPLHPECVAAVEAAAQLLATLGHVVEETHPIALDELEFAQHYSTLVTASVRHDIEYWSKQTAHVIEAADVEPYTWALAEMGRVVSAAEYIAAQLWLHAFSRRLAQWWAGGYDLLLSPTMIEPPLRLGELAASPGNPLRALERGLPLAVFTAPCNVSGQPAVSVPLHWSAENLPIGVQLAAAYGREDLLIRIAAELEEALPWTDRRPPVHA